MLASIPLGDVTTFASSAPTGTYYVRLRATNAAGQSLPTPVMRLDVGCVLPPAIPTGLRASVAGGSVTLNWDPASGNVGRYILEAGSGPGLSNLATAVLPPATLFSAAAPSGTYFIRVRAGNACGTSAPSGEIFVVVGSAATLPGPPSAPVPTVSGTNVSLAWTAPANGDPPIGYLLEAGTSPGLSNLARVTTGPATSFAASGVGRGTYYVRVPRREWRRHRPTVRGRNRCRHRSRPGRQMRTRRLGSFRTERQPRAVALERRPRRVRVTHAGPDPLIHGSHDSV